MEYSYGQETVSSAKLPDRPAPPPPPPPVDGRPEEDGFRAAAERYLTEDERRYLAMHARYESQRQDDPRYWNADGKRETLRARWREIADQLHPDPWGGAE